MSSPNNTFSMPSAPSIPSKGIRTRYIAGAICIVSIVLTILVGMFYYDKYSKLEDACKPTGTCETSVKAHKWISSLLLAGGATLAVASGWATILTWNQT